MSVFSERRKELGISISQGQTQQQSESIFDKRRRELEGGANASPSSVERPTFQSPAMQSMGGSLVETTKQLNPDLFPKEPKPTKEKPLWKRALELFVTKGPDPDSALGKIDKQVGAFTDSAVNASTFGAFNQGQRMLADAGSKDSQQRLDAQQGGAGMAGNIVGSVLPGALAWKAASAATKPFLTTLPRIADKAVTPIAARLAPQTGALVRTGAQNAGRGAALATRGATAGAAFQVPQEIGEEIFNTNDQSLKERLQDVGMSAAFGAVLDPAIDDVVGEIGRAAKGAIDSRRFDNAVKDFIKKTETPSDNLGIRPFAKQTGQKLRSPDKPENIKDLIDVGGRPEKENSTWEKFYSSIVDEQAPLKRVTTQIGGKDVPMDKNPFKTAWLARGWKGKADTKLQFGFLNAAGEKISSSLKDAIAPIKKRLDDWREYAVALRSKEYADVGLQSGVPPELADQTISKYANDAELLKADQGIKEYVYNMNQNTLVDSGIWSKEKLDQYRETQPNYIPMFRTREKGIRDGIQGAGSKSFGNVKDPTKKRTGGSSPIVDPLESIVKQTYKNQALAERNNVMRSLVELAETNPDNGIVQRVQSTSAIDEIQRSLDEFISTPSADLEKQLNDALDLFKPQTVNGQQNVFTVMRNGKAEQWQIMDDQLAKVIAGLGNEPSNPLINMVGKATGILKAGLVLAPDFVLRNLVRDQMSAFINSKYGFIPLVDTLSGLISAARKDDAFYKWMDSGGANGAWVSLERDYLQGQIKDITHNGIRKMGNPIEVLRKLSEWSEQGTRLGEFKRGMKKGASLKEAALASRDITLDFSRSGSKTKSANKAIAFFNVAVQSIDKMARQFKDRPAATPVKAALSITVPSILLYALNHDKDEYQELPQWEKDAYWHVFLGDEVVKIPKPFEMGIVFGTFFERMMQSVKQDDPEAFKGFAKTVWEGFQPSIVPTLLEPWIEAYANKDMFTKAPIVPMREQGLLPEDQFGPYTTELAKGIGELTNQSPRIIENYVRGYTGTLGGYGLQAADAVYRQATGKEKNERPDYGLASVPGIKSFFSKGLEGSSKSVDEFYSELDRLRRERTSARSNQQPYEEERAYKLYNSIADVISQYQKLSRLIQADPTLSGDEKAQRLEQINLEIINLARQAKGQEPIKE